MKISVKYDITDMFGHSQTIEAEKSWASFIDYKKVLAKLKKTDAGYMVLFAKSNIEQPITQISCFYDTEEDKKNDIFTVELRTRQNKHCYDKCDTKRMKRLIVDYCGNDEVFYE